VNSEIYHQSSEEAEKIFMRQQDIAAEKRLQLRERIMEAVTRHHDEVWHMAHRRREEILKGRQDF
jgi:hypothetical protein